MYQSVTICGNLGREPELKFFEDGNSICSFSVATSRKWKDKNGEPHEKTKWWNVKVRNKMGEACQKYLAKGRPVLVVGELEDREYEKDGQTRQISELFAREVKFLGSKPNGDGAQSGFGGDGDVSDPDDF